MSNQYGESRVARWTPKPERDFYNGRPWPATTLTLQEQEWCGKEFKRTHPNDVYDFGRTIALARMNGVSMVETHHEEQGYET